MVYIRLVEDALCLGYMLPSSFFDIDFKHSTLDLYDWWNVQNIHRPTIAQIASL